jgi:hypothetical protein
MEYEIYYLCNMLGMILVVLIVLFHFVEADKKKNEQVTPVVPEKKEKIK